jgi:2-dehydropantoate 2-reductase
MALPDSTADRQIAMTARMGPYKASTLVDFERGQELELEGLFLAPLRVARAAGVAAPRLAALCAILSQLAVNSSASLRGNGRMPISGAVGGR